jgi:hypothetical protein
MKRIDKRTVEFEGNELEAFNLFNLVIEGGHTVEYAIAFVRNNYLNLSQEFYDYLLR